MPLLVLVRHAKAEVPTGAVDDFDRTLTIEGRGHAKALGERLAQDGVVPADVVVSSANRAQQTWKRMADSFPGATVHEAPELYEAGIGGYQQALLRVGRSDAAMTVAHEPGCSGFARWLAGEGSDRDAVSSLALGLVTSGAAVLELPELDDLYPGCGRLVALYSGKR